MLRARLFAPLVLIASLVAAGGCSGVNYELRGDDLVRSGDYYTAWNRAEVLKEALGDLPAALEVDLAIKALERDAELHAIWNAQKEIVELRGRAVRSREEAEAAIAELEAIAARYPKHLLAREVELGLGTLRKKIEIWFE